MKEITNIKQISSNKYSLIIEGKKHVVYDDVLLEYNILKKGEISNETYNAIVNANNYHEAYNKMLKFITIKLRTEKEIYNKLSKLYINKDDQNKIVNRLKKEGYINNDNYVKSYINDCILLSLKGPKKIYYELKKLDFNESIIEKYLNEVDESLWYEKAEKLLNKKLKSNNKLSLKMFLIKIKKDYNALGYDEKYYINLFNNIEIEDNSQFQKDYEKIYKKYVKKYSAEKLNLMVKQKLFQLGYDLDRIEEKINNRS